MTAKKMPKWCWPFSNKRDIKWSRSRCFGRIQHDK